MTFLRTVPAILAATLLSFGCATTDQGDKGHDRGGDSGGSTGGGGGGRDDGSAFVSADRATLINSMSNNSLTSQTINYSRADQEANRLNGKDKRTLEGRLSAQRLARKDMGAVMGTAKRIAELEMSKNPEREISPAVKLDLALAAINNRKFSLAEFYLGDLIISKDVPPRIKAGALNAVGVVALKDDRVPEAVEYFKEALKVAPNYKPALLNLGFTALKGGDVDTAKRAFSDIQNDWFVQYGLVSVARLEGNPARASELCDRLLKNHPKHKPTLFNCAIHEFQARANYNEAQSLLRRMMDVNGGERGWNEKAQQMLAKIRQEEAKAKQNAAKKGGGQHDKKPDGKQGDGKGN